MDGNLTGFQEFKARYISSSEVKSEVLTLPPFFAKAIEEHEF